MNDKTAGLTRFNGERKHWKTWKKQRNGYKIINEEEFEGYDGIPDPRRRDRVTAAYVAQADDPTGAEEGDNVRVESEAAKKKKDREWAKIDRKWYHLQYNALAGKARELADDTDESGDALEQKLDEYYDTTTNAHAAYNLKKWVKTERANGTSIEQHSAAWLSEMKEIEANLQWDQIKCILYLQSLGPKYQSFFDIVASSNDDLDIHDLIKRAADHRRGEEDDEVDNSKMALAANEAAPKGNSNGTGMNMHSRPCANCRDRFHCAAECFRPGGGMSHLSREERQAWLKAKREIRERHRSEREREDDRNYRDNHRNGNKSQAFSAQEATIKALRAQIQVQERQIKDAADRGYSQRGSGSEMNF